MWRWNPFRNLSPICVLAITGGIIAVTCILIVAADGGGGDHEEDGDKNDLTHGMGSHIDWLPLKDGLTKAEQEDKPIMLIIHKSWCGACRSLKPKIKESKEMGELSKQFVMVNTMDDDEPPEDTYRPDGGYIPRILFFNPKGELMKDVINEGGNPQYKYYYYDVDSILGSMNKVMTMFQTPDDVNDQNQRSDNNNVGEENVEGNKQDPADTGVKSEL